MSGENNLVDTMRLMMKYIYQKAKEGNLPANCAYVSWYDDEVGDYVRLDRDNPESVRRFIERYEKEAECPQNEGLESDNVPEKSDTKPAMPQSPPSRTQGT